MAQFVLDPNSPPDLTADERTRLEALSDAQITAAAQADPDNPPLSEEELARLEAVRRVRQVRARTGLEKGL